MTAMATETRDMNAMVTEAREMTAMATGTRKSGIDVVGDIPWGSHFCFFYDTKEDLVDTLISYCRAGLESDEFCLWVVAEPLTVEQALDALKDAVPNIRSIPRRFQYRNCVGVRLVFPGWRV